MSSVLIPVTPGEPHQQFATALDGVTVTFEFLWNARDASWRMSMRGFGGAVEGRKVVLAQALLGPTRWVGAPQGEVFAVDTSGTNTEATLDDLGRRVALVYMTPDDLA